ncbi:MAG: Tfp pilus assembly protein PilO [Ascidiaceihabitans sp.]
MSVSEINNWIVAHQALVATIMIPILTLFVSWVVSYASEKRMEKSRRADRLLQTELKLVEFRQAWISELREKLALFHSLTGQQKTENLSDTIECFTVYSSVMMSMNIEDPLVRELSGIMTECTEDLEPSDLADAHVKLTFMAQKILKAEWERLKNDLTSVENRVR